MIPPIPFDGEARAECGYQRAGGGWYPPAPGDPLLDRAVCVAHQRAEEDRAACQREYGRPVILGFRGSRWEDRPNGKRRFVLMLSMEWF